MDTVCAVVVTYSILKFRSFKSKRGVFGFKQFFDESKLSVLF